MRYLLVVAVLLAFEPNGIFGQTRTRRPLEPAPASTVASVSEPTPRSIPLAVPTGMALKIVLNQPLRIRRVGQPIYGRIAEPVYAFDQMVIPAGATVVGEISAIDQVPKKQRIMASMNGNFSPPRQVHIVFTDLVLADGLHVPVKTEVSRGSGSVLQFLPAGETKEQPGKKGQARNLVSREVKEAEKAVKRDWLVARMQLKEPGKMQKVRRFAIAQLPYHPQYMDSDTTFNAELLRPLDFGLRRLAPTVVEPIASPLPAGSVVHANLITPLDSAHSKKGDPVEAVVTQPLISSGHLFLPEGSRLTGSVLQVRSAGKFSRNGQLRLAFHQVAPPGGVQQTVEASLEGVTVDKGEHLRLDSEGGAQVTTPKTRYLTTAISIALASSSTGDHDRDAGFHGADGGDIGKSAANGASGFRFLGAIIGALSHSRAVTSGFGFYGAGISVYSRFLGRGRDVVYPKDMSMTIAVGTNQKQPAARGTTDNATTADKGTPRH